MPRTIPATALLRCDVRTRTPGVPRMLRGMPRARARACSALILVAALLSAPAAAQARVTSRAPTASEYRGIARAFAADRRHRGDRIEQVRVTRSGTPIARVFYVPPKGRTSTARDTVGPGLNCVNCTSAYERHGSEWKPDYKLSRALLRQLHAVVDEWTVVFKGSGTDDRTASAPGDVVANPSCKRAPAQESDGSSFSFRTDFAYVAADDRAKLGVGTVTGSGSSTLRELPGCVNQTDPIVPQTQSCTVTISSLPVGRGLLARMTLAVDARGNHEVRVHAQVPTVDPSDCAAPDDWWIDSAGPVVFLHSVLVPDASLAAGRFFGVRVGARKRVDCFDLSSYPHYSCDEALRWSGEVFFQPQGSLDF